MQLTMLQPRPVDPKWKCQRSGECCTVPAEVVMTRQEKYAVLRAAPDGIRSEWRDVDDNFVAVKAHPCPFFIFKECVVYESRPYNCRRFGCMRPDPKAEPLTTDAEVTASMMERVQTSRVARRMAERMQRHAQRWAVKMGWMDAARQ